MAKKTLPLASFALALYLDLEALQVLLGAGTSPPIPWRAAAAFHAAALLPTFLLVWTAFPSAYRKSPATAAALVLGFCGPLPVVGLLFLIAFRMLLERKPVRRSEKEYFFGDRQALTVRQSAPIPETIPRSILEILNGKNSELRRKAILALRSVDPKKAIPVLQKAVQDSDEQVRLLAQTQLNKITAGLETTIKMMEQELAGDSAPPEKFWQLAEQYHELVYLGLSSEETESLYLNRAIELLTRAVGALPSLQAARFLLLKCQVKIRDTAAARKTLAELKPEHFQPEFLLPWEAELFFQERNFAAVEHTLQQMQTDTKAYPRLKPLLDLWVPTAAGRPYENR